MEPRFLKHSKLLLLCLIVISIGIGSFLLFLSKNYFVICPITYNKSNHPVIDVKIENSTYPLDLSIGTRFPLFLSQEILDQIPKKPHGTTEWHDIAGTKHEAPSYLIPEIRTENLKITNVIAIQTSEKRRSSLGKSLAGEFNLFLDFPNSRIIACSSFSKLKAKKIVTDHWIQVPFKITRMGVVFQVDTDLGMCNLSLNTTCTTSTLKPSLSQSKKTFTSSKFCIGEREFRSTSLDALEIPDVVHEIDGFIGMDFLKKHAIYLDYSNKIAYFEPSLSYCESFPVTFERYGIPTIKVQIEDNIYPLEINLGSNFLVSLNHKILQSISKTSYGTSSWTDFKGNKYQSPAYIIPQIKIRDLELIDTPVSEDREDFHATIAFNSTSFEQIGSIGRPILEKYNLFLDFCHSTIYFSNSLSSLQQENLLSKNLMTIPFVLHRDGILLSIETDSGTQHLILDTGATRTAIRAPFPTSTSKFRLTDHDFGTQAIFPLELHPDFDYDGLLGMDFLQKHSLFIDYPNKLIYIDLQKSE